VRVCVCVCVWKATDDPDQMGRQNLLVRKMKNSKLRNFRLIGEYFAHYFGTSRTCFTLELKKVAFSEFLLAHSFIKYWRGAQLSKRWWKCWERLGKITYISESPVS
jgi:hypothetical protein